MWVTFIVVTPFTLCDSALGRLVFVHDGYFFALGGISVFAYADICVAGRWKYFPLDRYFVWQAVLAHGQRMLLDASYAI